MKFFAAVILACCLTAHAAEPLSPPAYEISELPSPARGDSKSPSFATAPDGTIWLAWLEPHAAGQALRCASFDRTTHRWLEPHTISTGNEFVASNAETPLLTAGAGRITAAWPVMTGGVHHVVVSTSTDAGVTWSSPVPLTRETPANEFAALTTLADGRVLAAWLDGRATTATTRATRVYARVLDFSASNSTAPDVLIASLACDCCPPSLTPFADGSALLAYRGRSEDEIRDILVARFNASGWSESRELSHDLWRIAGCPVNGPRLAADGGRVAAAWFTAAENQARVLVSTSSDAGSRFLRPLVVDNGHPVGHPDLALLHDGAALVAWLEAPSTEADASPAGLWLRRVAPAFSLDEPVLLSSASATKPTGYPRVALLRDFTGGNSPAQLLVAYNGAGGIHTLLVNVPEDELLAQANESCHCMPTSSQLVGFPVRGRIEKLSDREVTVAHPELPGLLAGGSNKFHVAPAELSTLAPGREFLGRIERRSGAWWLFDVRLLVAPPAKK